MDSCRCCCCWCCCCLCGLLPAEADDNGPPSVNSTLLTRPWRLSLRSLGMKLLTSLPTDLERPGKVRDAWDFPEAVSLATPLEAARSTRSTSLRAALVTLAVQETALGEKSPSCFTLEFVETLLPQSADFPSSFEASSILASTFVSLSRRSKARPFTSVLRPASNAPRRASADATLASADVTRPSTNPVLFVSSIRTSSPKWWSEPDTSTAELSPTRLWAMVLLNVREATLISSIIARIALISSGRLLTE
mmetsp:Transcript_59966/g.130071  ORF Transcript_59966/g.130071 Transcript_59966/m.130071 type:complete len:250 (+) Transcript_59966:619-1368(+)